MTGVVRGIREVRQVTVSVEGPGVAVLRGEHIGLRRGPVLTRMERVSVELSGESMARVVGRRIHWLPVHTGAGPCGTLARGRMAACCPQRYTPPGCYEPYPRHDVPSPFMWSIQHLIDPLALFYATYVPPIRLGAKGTPRGRRAACV